MTNRRRKGGDKIMTEDVNQGGERLDPGPYLAQVVGHVENSRMGELWVTIPDWSGYTDVTDQGSAPTADSGAIRVRYASPFFGKTTGGDTAGPNTPATTGQSYGMWMVPPDIGNNVLVIFANGKKNRGYWFACTYESPSHHMVPGMARSIGGSQYTSSPGDALNSYINNTSVLPVVEYDIGDPNAFNSDGLTTTMRYPHEYQTMVLVKQGLDQDPIRGAISSSSLREAPSNVYGISTPGRKATPSDQYAKDPLLVFYRKGGHQFVMDDGDTDGKDQLIRLRTSGGHQVLMNDTENVLYIASASGSQWMEFSADGSFNVYAAAGINMRSMGPMNFHSDSTINMNAESVNINGEIGVKVTSLATIGMSSLGAISIASGGETSVSAGGFVKINAIGAVDVTAAGPLNLFGTPLALNCLTKPPLFIPPIPAIPHISPDTVFTGTGWQAGSTLHSICKVVPTHEPWTRPAPKN